MLAEPALDYVVVKLLSGLSSSFMLSVSLAHR